MNNPVYKILFSAILLLIAANFAFAENIFISKNETSKSFIKQISKLLETTEKNTPIRIVGDEAFSGSDEFKIMQIWLKSTLPFEITDNNSDLQNNQNLKNNYIIANNVNNGIKDLLKKENYTVLKADKSKVFAYMFSGNEKRIIVIGNLDFEKQTTIALKISNYNPKKHHLLPIKISDMPQYNKRKLIISLPAGSVYVLIIT